MDEQQILSFDTQSIDGSLPPYSPSRSGDAMNKEFGERKKGASVGQLVRSWTDRSATENDTFVPDATTAPQDWTPQHDTWHDIRDVLFTKRQAYALLVLFVFGIAPFVVVGVLLRQDRILFYTAFSTKTQGCDGRFGAAVNSTVEGIQALFVLDRTYGRFSFSEAKIIDASWDLVVGRCVQLCAWLLSYVVFSDAVLRLIEQHPTPFRAFMRLTLEGPSVNTAWVLLLELFRARSKRTCFLFCYLLLSTAHVLAIPPFLSAMTGYDSRTVPYVNVGENNIMPASNLRVANVVTQFPGVPLDKPTCELGRELADWGLYRTGLQNRCNCKAPNGTIMRPDEWRRLRPFDAGQWDCHFNYTGQTQVVNIMGKPERCNQTFPITLKGVTISAYDVTMDLGYCLGKQGFEFNQVYKSTRCIPDTADPTYVWGFSTMLAAIFVVLQLIWSLSMYALWQDAQWNSRLVRSGFRLTELRSAFALTEAAHRETGLNATSLIRHDARGLKEELYGKGRSKGADVGLGIIWDEELEVRRRRGIAEERLVR